MSQNYVIINYNLKSIKRDAKTALFLPNGRHIITIGLVKIFDFGDGKS